MIDPRLVKLANILVKQSLKVKHGEQVLIENNGIEVAFLQAIIKAVYDVGGCPHLKLGDTRLTRELLLGASEEQMKVRAAYETKQMELMDCYIGFSSRENFSSMSDVPSDKMALYGTYVTKAVHRDIRIENTRWVVLRFPSPAMAQLADMSEDAFEDFFFEVCTVDYSKMATALEPLKKLMEETDQVRIISPCTDLRFSIKGLPSIPCAGEVNIPDGEIYSAPVKDSVEGTISYNTPSREDGFNFENIKLTFEKGKIIEATANDTERINAIFDRDEGARYVGEFAIGVNPMMTKVINEPLFDEKVAGSIHFTPGNAYEDCDNGNRSIVHWDLVLVQTEEYGGGEIWFDDQLIRKDGIFIPEILRGLNPENLK